MSIRQQRFGLGDRLLCREDDGLLFFTRGRGGFVVELPAAEERGHRAERTDPGSEGERFGQAVGEGRGDQVGEELPAGQIVRGGRGKVGRVLPGRAGSASGCSPRKAANRLPTGGRWDTRSAVAGATPWVMSPW